MAKLAYAGGLLVALLAFALPAFAQHPYTGFWDNPDEGASDSEVAERCALSFFEQRPDGHYSSYVLDRQAFEARKEIVYKRYGSGACTYEGPTHLEICHSEVDLSDRADQAYTLYDVLTDLQPGRITYVDFESLEEARTALANGELEDSEASGVYVRCPIAAETLKAHSTLELSTASEDEIGVLIDPDYKMMASGLPAAVLKILQQK